MGSQMNRIVVYAGLVCALLLSGQTEEARVPVNFQEMMVPMRDGARLQTVILSPKSPKGPLPFLIDRTPYGVPSKESAGRPCAR